jgi:hypothetical protein
MEWPCFMHAPRNCGAVCRDDYIGGMGAPPTPPRTEFFFLPLFCTCAARSEREARTGVGYTLSPGGVGVEVTLRCSSVFPGTGLVNEVFLFFLG